MRAYLTIVRVAHPGPTGHDGGQYPGWVLASARMLRSGASLPQQTQGVVADADRDADQGTELVAAQDPEVAAGAGATGDAGTQAGLVLPGERRLVVGVGAARRRRVVPPAQVQATVVVGVLGGRHGR